MSAADCAGERGVVRRGGEAERQSGYESVKVVWNYKYNA